jgi:predicted Zn finger-like uncharacterized protein
MEVLCDRCQTEYDFDDALVSERGTTVKCTNCGHQFRIFRPKAAAAPPERWEVRTRKGQAFVFTSLRELQRAITRGQVERDDVLMRTGLAQRVLSSIAELEPFFPSTVNRVPTPVPPRPEPGRGHTPTPHGLGGGAESRALPFQATMPTGQAATAPVAGGAVGGPTTKPGLPPVTPPVGAPGPKFTGAGTQIINDDVTYEPETMRRPHAQGGPPPRELPPVQASPAQPAPKLPVEKIEPPADVMIREKRDLSYTPTPSDIRAVYAGGDESVPESRYVAGRKSGGAVRWIVGFVLVGAVIVAGAAVGRKYLRPKQGAPAAAVSIDPRAAEFLQQGNKQLLDGDLDGAKENFDKASALAEQDVRVRVQLARLANVKADLLWLKLRVMSAEQAEAVAVVKHDAEEAAKRAMQSSQHAVDIAPQDPAALRARVDAFRLSGDLASARKLVGQVASQSGEPETAYVLAALDMSEQSPNWVAVVDRLKSAVAGEQGLGRARGALVYALASAGQVEAAQAELETLAKAPRAFPLLVELKAFVARQPARKDAGAIAMAEGGIDPSSLPLAQGGPLPAEPQGGYQDLLAQGHAARASGDLARAEQLYRAVLAKNPTDTEALSGLGDIAKARGDQNGSQSYYEQVQKSNPGYVPALMGLADSKWDSGDKAGAVALYRQVIDKTGGQGPYADRARQRIAAAPAAPPATATATATATASQAPPKPTATSTSTSTSAPPPGVDTSDLPGWKPQ